MAEAIWHSHNRSLGGRPVNESIGVGGLTALPIEVEPGACYLAAVAPIRGDSSGVGLAAAVGRQRAQNHGGPEGAGTTLAFCAEGEERALLEIETRGAGVVWLARGLADRAIADRPGTRVKKLGLAAIAFALCVLAVGCARRGSLAPGAPGSGRFGPVESPLVASRWLAPDAARARAAGAGESVVVAVEAGAAGDRVSGMLALPEKECGLLIARASGSIEDVDLFAYGDDGTVLGADEAPDKTPALIVCPPHPSRIYLSARVAAGHGLVALGAQRVAPDQALRVARAIGARGLADDPTRRLEAWPGLDDRIAEHRRMIGAKWQDLRRVAVPIDARLPTNVSAAIDDKGCVDVLVIPSDEVSHLDVAAVDLDGRIIGRAAAVGRDRALIVCSPTRAALTVEIRPHAGQRFGGGGDLAADRR